MTAAKIKEKVKKALEPITHQVLHPEGYDINTGGKLPKYFHGVRGKPLAPRDRLSVRLVLLCALKEIEIEIMKATLEDKEAAADAKEHLDANRR